MPIWVDADACPVAIKEILFRAASRRGVLITLVANQPMYLPRSPNIRFVQVARGFDVADHEIVKRMADGDLVITADIPLAADVIAKGGLALSPRGELYSRANIEAALSMRNFMDGLRSSGVDTGGPPALSQRDRQLFANELDKWLVRSGGRGGGPGA
ncbi:MAG: YaiI/YqxD family protein [Burkholderiaceae bacterium]